jgi:hypothetical protein
MKTKTLSQKLDHFQEDKMSEEMILEGLRNFQADSIWFDQQYEELKRKYKDEWVAVFHKQVIDHDKKLNALLQRLRKSYFQDVGDMVIEFVSPEEVNLIL